MKDPDVSVIIPSYNSSRWILQAVDSAFAQNDISVEVLLIDDGSTDNSVDIIRAQRPAVKIFRKSNGGVSSARNVGIASATGKYIKFLDADDLVPPGSLDKAFRFAEFQKGGIIVGRTAGISADGYTFETDAYNIPIRPTHGSLINPSYLLTQATSSSIWLIERDAIHKDLRFPEGTQLGEEYRFSRLLVQLDRPFRYYDDLLCIIREHNGERLSRKGREVDYLRQLHEIEDNAKLIALLDSRGSSAALDILAKRTWTLGRDCLRAGFLEAAKRHFFLAETLAGSRATNGRVLYRLLVKTAGPFTAERVVSLLKKARL